MDPISDIFVRIQNGYRARKATVVLPYSRTKERIAEVLAARRFVNGVEKRGRKVRKFLEVELRYDEGAAALQGMRRLSKPSRHLYLGVRDIRPVRQGFGLLILSTPLGIMAGEDARRAGVGGEAIAEVW